MTVLCIIQARMASSRLPGKVLLPIGRYGPALGVLIDRVKSCSLVDAITVATTTAREDDAIELMCRQVYDVAVYRGDTDDVLSRFVGAAQDYGPDLVVRLTADCPLVDPEIIGYCVTLMANGYLRTDDTFPEGLDVEVFTRRLLLEAHAKAGLPAEREHVTLWMKRHVAPSGKGTYGLPENLGHIRVTLDCPEDYVVLSNIARHEPLPADWCQLRDLYARRPSLFVANMHIPRNEWLVAADAELAAAQAQGGPP